MQAVAGDVRMDCTAETAMVFAMRRLVANGKCHPSLLRLWQPRVTPPSLTPRQALSLPLTTPLPLSTMTCSRLRFSTFPGSTRMLRNSRRRIQLLVL